MSIEAIIDLHSGKRLDNVHVITRNCGLNRIIYGDRLEGNSWFNYEINVSNYNRQVLV